MDKNLIFTGYHDFDGKNGNHYYVLDFITEPTISEDKKRASSGNTSIFTTEEKYFNFIKNIKLLSLVSVKCEIVGDKVKYLI